MRKRSTIIYKCSVFILFIIITFVAVGFKCLPDVVVSQDISNIRSIKAVHLVSKYNPKVVSTKFVSTFNEVLQYGSEMPVKFNATMTGYGPDCAGCSGILGCPPRHNAKNGNIYFNDNTYGTTRIVAVDSKIPCGSIMKITNSTIGSEVVAIALDHGGAIKNNKIDLLVENEALAKRTVGRQSVLIEIVRWGW